MASESENTNLCIGIDLGTTNSVLCYYNPDSDGVEVIANDRGDRLTPSCVKFLKGEVLVGTPAQEDLLENEGGCEGRCEGKCEGGCEGNNEKNNEENVCISHVKRFIGKNFEDAREAIEMLDYPVTQNAQGYPMITVAGHKYKPEEISAQVLHYLKQCAEESLGVKITEAVITVPAYFNEAQRRATKDAATIAGLKCLRLVAEPTAACLCYGLHKGNNETVLVYDLGGGTLDCSILNLTDDGVFQVVATKGDTQLGGADVDFMLREFVEYQYRTKMGLAEDDELPEEVTFTQLMAEQVKKNLSHSKQTTIRLPGGFKYVMTRNTLEVLMHDFIEKCLEPVDAVLTDAQLQPTDISQIVLVGGSTRIPLIQKRLREMFGNKPLNRSVNPDEAVAYGAAIQASILKQVGSATKDLILLDVTPLSLGIETAGGCMSNIIPRNTTLPCEASKIFSTVEDNQEVVAIKVFQGERQFTRDNFKLGIFLLEGLPLTPRGVPKIKVSFRLDCDGLLEVTATDKNTGLVGSLTLQSDTNLKDEEVQMLIQEAERYRAADSLRKQALEKLDQFRQYLYDVQRQINLEEMDDMLGGDRSNMNQYLLEAMGWVDMHGVDGNYDLEEINNNRETVEYTLKPYLNKMYSHQEELQMSGIQVTNNTPTQSSGQDVCGVNELIDNLCEDLQ